MEQSDLFKPTGIARARNADPETSHQAAKQIETSGKAGTQRAEVLAVVQKFPGSTAGEIAFYGLLDRHAVSRRLPELREMGKVVNGPARKCRSLGSNAMTWDPA